MAGRLTQFFDRRRSRKRLKAWTCGWLWAMGELMSGKSVEEVESHIYWNDPTSFYDDGGMFNSGADTAVQDFAALSPCDCPPSPIYADAPYIPERLDPKVIHDVRRCLTESANGDLHALTEIADRTDEECVHILFSMYARIRELHENRDSGEPTA